MRWQATTRTSSRCAYTQALDAFLDRLFMLEGVERTETTMVLRTNAERPMHLPFEDDGKKQP